MTALLLGAGHMGSAIARGWARDRDPAALCVVDPDADRRAALTALGFPTDAVLTPENARAATLILAVKPDQIAAAAAAYAEARAGAGAGAAGEGGALVISIAAGVTLATLGRVFPGASVVRAMPNTAAALGFSATTYTAERLSAAEKTETEAVLATLGSVARAPGEAAMDAVTAVAGSGPAYVFALTEALAAAGEAEGLPADLAAELARRTVIGAGRLLEARADPPSALRAEVTSPGGTTAAALGVLLAEDGLPPLLRRAVAAAAARSRALGS